MRTDGLTHIGVEGEARMVDVSDKTGTARVAIAEGRVRQWLVASVALDDERADHLGRLGQGQG